MFFYGIKKFPNNTNLRLAYSFYLLEYKKYKQQSLQELSMAEQNHPPFDVDFIIYRYKKIIEDEIAESQNDGNMDIVSEMAFQNHMRLMQNNIERSALMYTFFFEQIFYNGGNYLQSIYFLLIYYLFCANLLLFAF